jgi:polynucleotide 5'-kinase involved in rRNA processing
LLRRETSLEKKAEALAYIEHVNLQLKSLGRIQRMTEAKKDREERLALRAERIRESLKNRDVNAAELAREFTQRRTFKLSDAQVDYVNNLFINKTSDPI